MLESEMRTNRIGEPNPYNRGRWYKCFIESTGEAYVIGPCDLDVNVSSNYLVMPDDFKVLDTIFDINSDAATANNFSYGTRLMADGNQAVIMPNKANFTDMEIYIFGYFK